MARKDKKYHFIYKTTNLINDKYYIGTHSTENLDDGYMGYGRRLKYSLKKYGKENHKTEILEFLESRKKLKIREEEIVNLNEIAKNECMNLQIGGGGGFINEDHIEKCRKGASKWMKKQWENEEFRNKINSLSSDRMKQNHKNGKIKYDTFTGKTHSKKTKNKMSKSKKGRSTGKENSQYGTCWITKDNINKKIKKEELNKFINLGWEKGRKI